jgi:hypothetical protein
VSQPVKNILFITMPMQKSPLFNEKHNKILAQH